MTLIIGLKIRRNSVGLVQKTEDVQRLASQKATTLKAKEGETIAHLPSSGIANTCTTIVLNDDVQKGGRPKGTTKVSKLNIDEKSDRL